MEPVKPELRSFRTPLGGLVASYNELDEFLSIVYPNGTGAEIVFGDIRKQGPIHLQLRYSAKNRFVYLTRPEGDIFFGVRCSHRDADALASLLAIELIDEDR